MKTPLRQGLAVLITQLILISSGIALPLTVTIFQESTRLRNKVAAWNKQCGAKPYYDETCTKKRQALCRELGGFVALVNDELGFLRGPVSPDCPDDLLKEANGRRKIMELEVRIALHDIKCLGVPASDPQCSGESAAIETDKANLRREYAQTHAAFDGEWISLRATVSPAPKKP